MREDLANEPLTVFGTRRDWLEWALMQMGPGFIPKHVFLDHLSLAWPALVATRGVAQPPQWHPEGDVWTHSHLTVDAAIMARAPFHLRVAALFHDIGKPVTASVDENGRIRFNGHDEVGADMADEALARTGFGADERSRIVTLIREHMVWGSVCDMRAKTRRKLYARQHFDDLLALHMFDVEAASRDFSVARFVAADQAAQRDIMVSMPEPVERLITGKDVMDAGWPQGPHIGRILGIVEAGQRDGTIRSREDALAKLDQLQGEC